MVKESKIKRDNALLELEFHSEPTPLTGNMNISGDPCKVIGLAFELIGESILFADETGLEELRSNVRILYDHLDIETLANTR